MNIEYYRLHHIRSRFKNDAESVLFFMANEINNIGTTTAADFKHKINNAIKFYPGNTNSKEKTINNWRTEISSLFGLIIEQNGNVSPSSRNNELYESGNLIEFFRNFLYYFQYPGGHLKPKQIVSMISSGIKFKPAHYLLGLLVYGTEQYGDKRFGISKAEATHLIFNNLSITRDRVSFDKVFRHLIDNRKARKDYENAGDIVRYAGDILDYMVLADLLDYKHNKYYPKMQNKHLIDEFLLDDTYFTGYDHLYGRPNVMLDEVKAVQYKWQLFASQSNSNLKYSFIDHSETAKIEPEGQRISVAITDDIKKRLKEILTSSRTTLDIGNLGEAITIEHEKNRISSAGGKEHIHKIQKLPERYSMGFDIKSLLGLDGDFSQIFIEVKSTISRNKLSAYSFNLTSNEFSAAKTHRALYFIYRIFMTTEDDISLFVIKDPINKIYTEHIDMNPTTNGNGVQCKFAETAGEWKKLLI